MHVSTLLSHLEGQNSRVSAASLCVWNRQRDGGSSNSCTEARGRKAVRGLSAMGLRTRLVGMATIDKEETSVSCLKQSYKAALWVKSTSVRSR